MLGNLANKKILILGLGREGISTYQFLRRLFPEKVFGLADRLPLEKLSLKSLLARRIRPFGGEGGISPTNSKVRLHLGPRYLKSLADYDLIIKTPGIPPFPQILKAKNMGKITSQVKLFFENCPGTIIGVTGTKGKSTTTSLIYQILKLTIKQGVAGVGGPPKTARTPPKSGEDIFGGKRLTGPRQITELTIKNKQVFLAGNIGQPVLPLLKNANKETLFVFELSSHQLMDLTTSPHITVLLNLYPEHLDYYKNFSQYAQAKANITRFQTAKDWLIYNLDSSPISLIAQKSKAKKISFSLVSKKADLYLKNNWIYYKEEKITPISLIPLLGKFNLTNVMPAVAVAKIFEIPHKTIVQAIKTFQPLPHRLELVGTYKGVTFYNDALATIPEATIAAIQTLNEKNSKVATILLGGFDRKLDFEKLAHEIIKQKVKTVILFPTTGEKIWQAICKGSDPVLRRLPGHFFVDNMKKAVKLAYQHTPKGKICLLSTASSSFSIFKDYREKGELFKKEIREQFFTVW